MASKGLRPTAERTYEELELEHLLSLREIKHGQFVPPPPPPRSDSSLNSVLISPCWKPKPIIKVFCQKRTAHQGGGGEGSACPSLSHPHPLG